MGMMYQFLIIAYLFTLDTLEPKAGKFEGGDIFCYSCFDSIFG